MTQALRSVHVPPEAESVKTVRDFVEHCCADWGLGTTRDVAVLLASELTTNSVRYARTPITVWLGHRSDRLVLSVEDASHSPATAQEPQPQDEGGRGLLLVREMSQRWGERDLPNGKRVWAEIATGRAAPPARRDSSSPIGAAPRVGRPAGASKRLPRNR